MDPSNEHHYLRSTNWTYVTNNYNLSSYWSWTQELQPKKQPKSKSEWKYTTEKMKEIEANMLSSDCAEDFSLTEALTG